MAERMKDYKIFKCPYCSCEYYDKKAHKGKNVGDPMVVCPDCGNKSYRSSILEPALISGSRYFDIKFSSTYGNFRIGLILIYAVFLFIVIVKKEFMLSIALLLAALALYIIYLIIRLLHMRFYLKSDGYNAEIALSLERLSDNSYARMVVNTQGIEKNSVYYYEINQKH